MVIKNLSTKILIYSYEEYSKEEKKLIEKAREAALRAYAPYSGFYVGAAVLLANGTMVTGNNQENASYPAGQCAERTAMAYANAQHPGIPVRAIAIAAYQNNEITKGVCSPCGICRQFLLEAENRFGQPVKVIMCSADNIYEVESVKDLLPLSFGKSNLI